MRLRGVEESEMEGGGFYCGCELRFQGRHPIAPFNLFMFECLCSLSDRCRKVFPALTQLSDGCICSVYYLYSTSTTSPAGSESTEIQDCLLQLYSS